MNGSPDLEEWLCKDERIRAPIRHVSSASGSNTCRFTTRSTSTPNLASVNQKNQDSNQKGLVFIFYLMNWIGFDLLLQES